MASHYRQQWGEILTQILSGPVAFPFGNKFPAKSVSPKCLPSEIYERLPPDASVPP